MSDRSKLIINGRLVGTNTDWDQSDIVTFTFFDYEPVADVVIPACHILVVDYHTGKIEAYNNDKDTPEGVFDLIDVIKNLPKVGI